MKALVYQGPWTMPVEEIPEPEPVEGEVKIRVKYCGICGSDIHGFTGASGRKIPPMIMGHEFSGTVVSVGPGVNRIKPGMRVSVLPYSACGKCGLCEAGFPNICPNRSNLGVLDVNGAFTQFICVPEKLCYILPDAVSFEAGAMLEPMAVAHHAVAAARPLAGKHVLLVGAGAIGQLILKLLVLENPASILVSDVSSENLDRARENGATAVMNPLKDKHEEVLRAVGISDGVDVSIEAVGVTPTAQMSVDCVKNCGRVIWVGNAAQMVSINMQNVVTRELHLRGSYAFTDEDFSACLKILTSGGVDPMDLVTARIDFWKVTSMITAMARRETRQVKVLVEIEDSITKG